jgi:hypothetical protein
MLRSKEKSLCYWQEEGKRNHLEIDQSTVFVTSPAFRRIYVTRA